MLPLILTAALLSVGIASLEPPLARRLAATGLLLLVIAWDSAAIGTGGSAFGPQLLSGGGSAFLAIDAGMALVGLGCSLAAVIVGLRLRSTRWRALPMLAGVALAAAFLLPILRLAGTSALPSAAAIGALVAALAGLGVALRRWRRSRRTKGLAEADPRPTHGWPRPWAGVAIVATIVTLAVPHLFALVGGALLAALASDARRWSAGRRIPAATLAVLALLPATWLLVRIAAPTGLSLPALAEGPLSEPAQSLLLLPILVAAAALAGLWPLHRLASPLLAPVGAALLLRLVAPILPDGVVHWQPLLFALAAAGAWWGAATGAAALVATSLGLAGAASAGPWAWIGAGVLFLSRPLFAVLGPRLDSPGWRPLWLVGAAGAALVLDGGLRREVTLTAVIAAGLVVAIWRPRAEPSAPLNAG